VLVTVPAEAEVNAATLRIQDLTDDAWERDPEVAGTVHGRRLLSFAPHNLRVVHGEEGLTVRAHGCTATFPSDQVVGILRSGPWLEVLRRDGRSLAFRPRDVRRGKELESAILERWGSLLVLDEVTSD
jgi:(p)ppGpp synthase/HD superfamily hydrolase